VSDRLTKSEWLRHGLRTLASDGPRALKVGSMSEKLNVSRGSFYWHFRDIEDFRSQLLQSWQEISTDQIITELDNRPDDPSRLRDLMHRAFSRQRNLDQAVRSWAAEDEKVASIVAGVDDRRIARVARLLSEAGVDSERAAHRATFPCTLSDQPRHGIGGEVEPMIRYSFLNLMLALTLCALATPGGAANDGPDY